MVARDERWENPTGWMLAPAVFALAGYPFAGRFGTMVAAMVAGLWAWYVASWAVRRVPLSGVVVLPELAFRICPGLIGTGKCAGSSPRTGPVAIRNGSVASLGDGPSETVFGQRLLGRSVGDRDVLS